MREITTHVAPGDDPMNEAVGVFAETNDEVGAYNHYELHVHPANTDRAGVRVVLPFQRGRLSPENPPNGITMEALLAVVVDRLTQFQLGPNPCAENMVALGYAAQALQALHARTARLRREKEAEMAEDKDKEEGVGNTATDRATGGRVSVQPDEVVIGETRISRESLRTWKGWPNRVEPALRKLKPAVTAAELAALEPAADTTPGRNGYNEIRQALARIVG